jgi:hypothetical protein
MPSALPRRPPLALPFNGPYAFNVESVVGAGRPCLLSSFVIVSRSSSLVHRYRRHGHTGGGFKDGLKTFGCRMLLWLRRTDGA